MSMRHSISQLLLIGTALATIPIASAAPIQYSITGTIDVQFQVGPLPPGVFQGAPFEAILSYDLATPDSQPDEPNRGIYSTNGVVNNFLLVRAGETFFRSVAPLTLDVGNDRDIDDPISIDGFPDDSFSLAAVPFEGNFEQPSISIMRLRLYDPTRLAFDSDALPTNLNQGEFVDPFSLDDPFIEISTFELDSRVHQFTVHGVIGSITVIPEPSAISLIVVVLIVYGHRVAHIKRPFL